MDAHFQAACAACHRVRPLFLSGNRMLCDRCATRLPAAAYTGSVVTVLVLGVLGTAAVVGLIFLFILRESMLGR